MDNRHYNIVRLIWIILINDFSYSARLLDASVKRTNVMYGGPLPDLNRVIFTNGNVDPWHALSIIEDTNGQTPVILINGIKQNIHNNYLFFFLFLECYTNKEDNIKNY